MHRACNRASPQVRELLWRLVDPALGFSFVVRRAVYTQRIVRVLQANLNLPRCKGLQPPEHGVGLHRPATSLHRVTACTGLCRRCPLMKHAPG